MAYAINHVHIRSVDPHASAAWYEKHFEAKIVSDREVMPGTITVSMEVGGPVRLNISSQPDGSSDERAVAELNLLGLEHFGFDVEDLVAELDKQYDSRNAYASSQSVTIICVSRVVLLGKSPGPFHPRPL